MRQRPARVANVAEAVEPRELVKGPVGVEQHVIVADAKRRREAVNRVPHRAAAA